MIKKPDIYKDLSDCIKKSGNYTSADEMTIDRLTTYVGYYYKLKKELGEGNLTKNEKNGTIGISQGFRAMNEVSKIIGEMSFKMGVYDQIKKKLHNYGKITKENSKFLK